MLVKLRPPEIQEIIHSIIFAPLFNYGNRGTFEEGMMWWDFPLMNYQQEFHQHVRRMSHHGFT